MTVEPPAQAALRTEERVLSVEAALRLAVERQQHGDLKSAARIYDQLAGVIDERHALFAPYCHFQGVLKHQSNQSAQALPLIEASLALEDGNAGWWNNYALALRGARCYDEAIDALMKVDALAPDMPETYNNLGLVQQAKRNLTLAETCFRRAIELKPDFAAGYHNLSELLFQQKRLRECVEANFRAITLMPQHIPSRKLLGIAHAELGEMDKARQIFEDILRDEPDSEVAQHHLAALKGETPERASDAYVRSTFDAFATVFDERLKILEYVAPELACSRVNAFAQDAGKPLDILDAGCGTGLCGPMLKPHARHLAGVDLSSGMLTQAQARGCYDTLREAELTADLAAHPGAYDVVISADTLCYFGALEEACQATFAALRPGGLFVFTVEAQEEDAGLKVFLQHNGRYRHALKYVNDTLDAAGFAAPGHETVTLRTEGGRPVIGYLVEAKRPA